MTAGRYTVAFRVVSADGHPVSAQTSFRFAPGGSAQPGTAQPGPNDARRARGGCCRRRVQPGSGHRHRGRRRAARRARSAHGTSVAGRPREPGRPSGPAVTGTRSSSPALHADNDAAVSRPELWRWVAGVALVTVSVLVVVLLAGGGAPQPVPAGLPDSGPVTGWGLPVSAAAHRPGRSGDGRSAAGGRAAALLAGVEAGRRPGPRGIAGRAGGRGVAARRGGRGRADRLGHLRHHAGAGDGRDGAAQLPGADVAGPGAARADRAADRRRWPGAGRGLAPRRGARSGGCAGRDDAAGADRALRIVRKPRARGREPAGAPGRGVAVGRGAGRPDVGGRRCGGRRRPAARGAAVLDLGRVLLRRGGRVRSRQRRRPARRRGAVAVLGVRRAGAREGRRAVRARRVRLVAPTANRGRGGGRWRLSDASSSCRSPPPSWS